MKPPSKSRIVPLLVLLVAAPASAELSSGYLSSSGDLLATASEMVFGFIPLYGFVAVVLREVMVRRGLGLVGLALLGLAFGLVQAGITDHSIFTLTGTGVPYWAEIVTPTWIEAWGLAVAPTVGWVLGHVVTSVVVPIVLVEALFPAVRGRSLVGWPLMITMTLLHLAIAVAVFIEVSTTYRPEPSMVHYVVVAVAAVVAVVVACSRIGRRGRVVERATSLRRAVSMAVLGALVMLVIDSSFLGWGLLAICLAVVGFSVVAMSRLWRGGVVRSEMTVFAAGALLCRAVQAFATPPGAGVTPQQMLTHTVTFLALSLVVSAVAWTRVSRPR